MEHPYHVSVMLQEVMDHLLTDLEGTYLDATLGGGGHSAALLERLGAHGRVIALDRDTEALALAQERFKDENRFEAHHVPFSGLEKYCIAASLSGALFDLGVSSHQLDAPHRGFTFMRSSKLDLRMDPTESRDIVELLREAEVSEIAGWLRDLADLPGSRRLAVQIKAFALQNDEMDALAFSESLRPLLPGQPQERQRGLARVFQALRMVVNRELEQIHVGLQAAVNALRIGGHLVVLSYHSVEDRAVKQSMEPLLRDCVCPPGLPVCICGEGHRRLRKILRKPGLPSETEIGINPRSRSAKLRVWERVQGMGNAKP